MVTHTFHRFLRLLLPLLVFCCTAGAAFAATSVNVMPGAATDEQAFTWAGKSITVWGNVRGISGPATTYRWSFGDGTADVTGNVSNADYIALDHAYAASNTYDATLTVTDTAGGTDSATVRIRVLPTLTKQAQINLAIEKGLRWLYLRYVSLGKNGQIYWVNSYSSWGAETASAVLAFENRGHRPVTTDQNGDGVVDAQDRALWEKGRIYAEVVHKGLDAAISNLTTLNLGVGNEHDKHYNNGIAVVDDYSPTSSESRSPYKIGMFMTALVGAGDLASGAPNLVATTGPTGVKGRTYRELVGDMIDYIDYSQYDGFIDGKVSGGWRYGPGYAPDNSACQWPAIGMEAAEFIWGVPVASKIKDGDANWVAYSQYGDGRFGYNCPTCEGTGGFAALTGAGICQLSFLGAQKNDARILAAGNFLKNNPGQRGTGNTYYMYSIAKGARIAKAGGAYSEIQLLGSAPGWDWYDEYSTWLINNQSGDGFWSVWSYTQQVLDTSFAVEILTRNVFTLRPVAVLEASPNPTPALSAIQFDVNKSSHQDPAKLLTQWKIDVYGDGSKILSGSFPVSGPVTFAGYPEKSPPANYTVNAKLTVTDNSPTPESAEIVLPITISTTKVPPVAKAGGPYNGAIGSPITFNGAGSYSPNPGSTIVKYEWDLDGNGSFETNAGTNPTVQNIWTTAYSGNIGLKVTDSDGLTGTSSSYAQVFVVDLWPQVYNKVSEKRITPFVYEYTYKFSMMNRGNTVAKNVKCTMDFPRPVQMTLVDDQVGFGDIGGGQVQWSTDTFSFRVDRRYPITDNQVRWKLEYDDVGGQHITYVNFPLR